MATKFPSKVYIPKAQGTSPVETPKPIKNEAPYAEYLNRKTALYRQSFSGFSFLSPKSTRLRLNVTLVALLAFVGGSCMCHHAAT